jgi:hypothetical protein
MGRVHVLDSLVELAIYWTWEAGGERIYKRFGCTGCMIVILTPIAAILLGLYLAWF